MNSKGDIFSPGYLNLLLNKNTTINFQIIDERDNYLKSIISVLPKDK